MYEKIDKKYDDGSRHVESNKDKSKFNDFDSDNKIKIDKQDVSDKEHVNHKEHVSDKQHVSDKEHVNHKEQVHHKQYHVRDKHKNKSKLKKFAFSKLGLFGIIFISIVVIVALFNNLHSTTNKVVNSDVVAEFNGKQITSEELNKIYDLTFLIQGIPKEYRSLISKGIVLNQTIMQDLLYYDALSQGYTITNNETDTYLNHMFSSGGITLDQFKTKLENESFNYDFFYAYIKKIVVLNKFVGDLFKNISLSDDDISNYYDSNKELFYVGDQIRVSHILVNTSSKAETIIEKLDQGGNFSELAKTNSLDSSSTAGGDLGYFGKGVMVPEFENASFNLKNIGDYTKVPVKTQFGYHIIKLTGKKDAKQQTLEEVKDQIKQTLVQQKQKDLLDSYVNNLFSKSDVKVYLKDESSAVKSVNDVSKKDVPKVELFVMAYCPYGTQIEKGILPVVQTLKDKIDFNIKFVNYAMHGEKELNEELRQYCIKTDYNSKYLDYLSKFLEKGSYEDALTSIGLTDEDLKQCIDNTDKKYKVSESYNDPEKTNWKGNYPSFMIYNDDNLKYGVRGSPTLVLNGKVVNSKRDSQSLLNVICDSFNDKPKECNTDLTANGNPSPGFGYTASSSTTQNAGCGA